MKWCVLSMGLVTLLAATVQAGSDPNTLVLGPGEMTMIQSPKQPDNYADNQSLHWLVQTAPGSTLKYSFFPHFQLESGDQCQYDNVTFYDSSTTTNMIESYCGSSTPKPGSTTGRYLYVSFKSNGQSTYKGFPIYVTSRDYVCGSSDSPTTYELGPGQIVHITSTDYPMAYPGNDICYWLVKTAPGNKLKYRFIGQYRVMGGHTDSDEYVSLYDSSTASNLIGSYYGWIVPPPGSTNGRYLYVKFKTYGEYYSMSNMGFNLEVSIQNKACESDSPVIYELSPGRTLTITSLNYPNNYPDNQSLYWLVKTAEDSKLNYRFIGHFQLDTGDGWRLSDNVTLYDSSNTTNMIGSYFGSSPPDPGTTTGRYLLVGFKSDDSTSYAGFNLEVTSKRDACESSDLLNTYVLGPGQTLVITTPFYIAVMYPDDQSLYWLVQTAPGSKLKYRFRDEFEIVGGDQCQYDNVTLYDSSTTSNMIGSYCGWSPPKPGTTTGRYLYVSFKSSSSSSSGRGNGFKLEITSNDYPCGSSDSPTLYELGRGQTINITSPNYPSSYLQDETCYWLLQAAPGNKINYRFIGQFQIERYMGKCDLDNVTLYDSSNTTNVIGSYCGSSPPNPGTTTGRYLLVTFKSSESGTYAGFNLEITSNEHDSIGGLTAVRGAN